jgi:hypothetical protein
MHVIGAARSAAAVIAASVVLATLGAPAALAQVPPPSSHPAQSADKSHGVTAGSAEDNAARTPVHGQEGQPRSGAKQAPGEVKSPSGGGGGGGKTK